MRIKSFEKKLVFHHFKIHRLVPLTLRFCVHLFAEDDLFGSLQMPALCGAKRLRWRIKLPEPVQPSIPLWFLREARIALMVRSLPSLQQRAGHRAYARCLLCISPVEMRLAIQLAVCIASCNLPTKRPSLRYYHYRDDRNRKLCCVLLRLIVETGERAGS